MSNHTPEHRWNKNQDRQIRNITPRAVRVWCLKNDPGVLPGRLLFRSVSVMNLLLFGAAAMNQTRIERIAQAVAE